MTAALMAMATMSSVPTLCYGYQGMTQLLHLHADMKSFPACCQSALNKGKDPYKDLSPEDKQKGKQLASAWIKMDKAAECKTILQVVLNSDKYFKYFWQLNGSSKLGASLREDLRITGAANQNLWDAGVVLGIFVVLSSNGDSEIFQRTKARPDCSICKDSLTETSTKLRASKPFGARRLRTSMERAFSFAYTCFQELQDIQSRCSDMFKQADVKVKINVGDAADNIAISVIESMTRELKKSKRGTGAS
eukprot:768792-Hanusia_phi.AAC.21